MTATVLRPIETIYKGFRFRSRLEARWAVFFDRCGQPFDYVYGDPVDVFCDKGGGSPENIAAAAGAARAARFEHGETPSVRCSDD